jgi:hypothetical protein
MPQFLITSPDGVKYRVNAPEGATEQDALAKVQAQATQLAPQAEAAPDSGILKNIAMGALKGASDIGATLLSPLDATGITGRTSAERRTSLSDFFKGNANPDSLAFKGGELGADIAGTAGIGGAIAKIPAVVKYAPKLAAAIESGGFRLNAPAATSTLAKIADMGTRAAGGAIVGGASAGLVNPDDAAMGAAIGGALPIVAKAAGAAGNAIGGKVSDEVKALYQKAQNLGIEIPADRITNSRPLNAVASSLNYVPLSGRAATEEKMLSQMNRALSRTFGQDSDNVTAALGKADLDLGAKFEKTLSNNAVKVDNQFVNDLVQHLQTAQSELGDDAAKVIGKQVDEIFAKTGPNGEIDGQAAYNIKKALDRLGKRQDVGYYAKQLKESLMGALDRSLGPKEAAEFAKVRQQYGAMLTLDKLAQNGAEGGVSVGRLANLKNIRNPEIQDIAYIAAQFLKTRENPHGAAQRVILSALGAGGAAGAGGLPLVGAGMAAGRVANTALNSNAVKNMLLRNPGTTGQLNALLANPVTRSLAYDLSGSNP